MPDLVVEQEFHEQPTKLIFFEAQTPALIFHEQLRRPLFILLKQALHGTPPAKPEGSIHRPGIHDDHPDSPPTDELGERLTSGLVVRSAESTQPQVRDSGVVLLRQGTQGNRGLLHIEREVEPPRRVVLHLDQHVLPRRRRTERVISTQDPTAQFRRASAAVDLSELPVLAPGCLFSISHPGSAQARSSTSWLRIRSGGGGFG